MRVLIECRSIRPSTSCGVENFLYSLVRSLRVSYPSDSIRLNIPPGETQAYREILPDLAVELLEDPVAERVLPVRRFWPIRVVLKLARSIHPALTQWLDGPRPRWTASCEVLADVVLYPYKRDRIVHRKRPTVLVMHDFYDFEYELRDPRVADLQRDSLRTASAVVVSWPGPFGSLGQLFPECMDKSFMIPFCFEPMPKLVEPTEVTRPRELLYAALTGPHKNHENLIRALGVLRRRGEPPLRVHCPGAHRPGRLEELGNLARKEGVDEWIEFHGFISREALRSLYREVGGIIAPTKYEAFSGTVLEAFQYGKPVACSRISQLTAFNDSVGAHVRYFDPDKPDDIADAMIDLTMNPEPYRHGSLRARAALELITPARTARQYREVLAYAAGTGPKPAWAPYEPLVTDIADGLAAG